MTSAIARTAIRAHNQQTRLLDDSLLLLACLACITATVLQSMGASTLYPMVMMDRSMAQFVPKEVISQAMIKLQKYGYSFAIIIWISIFSVKFSYLAFFRQLIDRQRGLIMYWRIVLAVTFVAAVLNICGSFISCPEFGDNAYKCANDYYARRVLIGESFTNALDILTDLLITSIPPILLHKVRIKLRQKVGLGSFLCLSVVMIIIVIIRISKIRDKQWEIWAIFWQQTEACFAILMLSTTAFRQLFICRHSSHLSPHKLKLSDTYRRYLPRWPKKSSSSSNSDNAHVSVNIPGATLTGVQTFIRGESGNVYLSESFDTLDREKSGLRDDNIMIRRDLEARSDPPRNVREGSLPQLHVFADFTKVPLPFSPSSR